MPDETTEQVIEPTVEETTETTETNTPTLEDVLKQNEELTKSIETQKKEIAGINKANTNFKTQYDELLKQNETESETKARELKEANDTADQERNDFLNQKAEFSKKENDFNVRVKALEMGFTADDIKALGFSSVESVEKYKTFLDAKIQTSKEAQTQEIESKLSGARPTLNNSNSSEVQYPSAIDKAFR